MSCCGEDVLNPQQRSGSQSLKPPAKVSFDVIALIVAGFIAGNSTLVTLVTNLSEMSEPLRHNFQTGLLISTVVVAALLAPQLITSIVANVRRRSLSVDGLFILGCSGAMGYSLLSYFRGSGVVYFEVFSILLVIYCLGNFVKRRAQRNVWNSLDAWSPNKHECRVIDDEGNLHNRLVANVQPGDLVRVPAGAMVPIDGIVVDGRAFVRESAITGEPHLRNVQSGDVVYASALLVDAALDIRATNRGNDRLIDRMTSIVTAAQTSPSRWQSQADRVALIFTPLVAFIAALSFFAWMWLTDVQSASMVALSVLLVACPCAFGFATPVSIWVTLSRLASRSLVVRRADVIERLAKVDTVVFDKTGTLTILQPKISEWVFNENGAFTRQQILSTAKSIEAHSHHPIATVFLTVDTPIVPTRNIELIPAVGVRGEVELNGDFHRVEIGRLTELHRPCCDSALLIQIRSRSNRGQQAIAIRIDEALVAAAIIEETKIDTLDEGLAKLRLLNVDVKLFSGDRGDRVDRIGIDDSIEAMTPESKASEVSFLQSGGRNVLFIGDGVNDAAAMSASTAAISVARGAALALESSDIVWHGNDLRVIADAISISRRSVLRLRRALAFAVTYNSIGMLIAAFGWLHPVVAVLLMLGSSLTVVFHAADANWASEQAEPALPLATKPSSNSTESVQVPSETKSEGRQLVQIAKFSLVVKEP